jgi:hypothetical protein
LAGHKLDSCDIKFPFLCVDENVSSYLN